MAAVIHINLQDRPDYLSKISCRMCSWTFKEILHSISVPHIKIKHKIALENIQRRATKELPGMRDLSYIERLKLLKLPTLAYRRLRGDMIEVYKIIHNIYDHESVPNLLKNNEISQRTGNRGHSLKLFTQRAKPNLRKNVFPIRITEPWNSLPDTVVTAKSLNSFNNKTTR